MTELERAARRHGRGANMRALLGRLAEDGPRSRSDLARELDVSPASVSRMVDALIAADLVVEGARVGSGRGRPQTLIDLREDAALVIGASVRARSVRLCVATLGGAVLRRLESPRVGEGAAALARQVAAMTRDVVSYPAPGRPLAAAVVGISGVWDPAGRRVFAAPHLPGLEGQDLEAELHAAMGDMVPGRRIVIENDVNLAALGEQAQGAARGVEDFFYLSLGTGIGGAVVIGGRLRRGAHGLSGEVGYLPVGLAGAPERLESIIGREALEARLAGEGAHPPAPANVFELLDPGTSAMVADHAAVAVAAVVVTVDPRLVVLGGAVGSAGEPLAALVSARVQGLVPTSPAIVVTQLGTDAALIGAVATATEMGRASLVARHLTEA